MIHVRAVPDVERRIYVLRGLKVMLSGDLADLYGVEPRTLIQAVKRNRERFPADFMFRLTRQEVGSLRSPLEPAEGKEGARLRSQIVILKRGTHAKYPPHAFTEQGVAMLSGVLRSPRAVRVNIAIMRAFVRLRGIVAAHRDLARQLHELEQKCDRRFRAVFAALRLLVAPTDPPRRRIGFRTDEPEKVEGRRSRRRA